MICGNATDEISTFDQFADVYFILVGISTVLLNTLVAFIAFAYIDMVAKPYQVRFLFFAIFFSLKSTVNMLFKK